MYYPNKNFDSVFDGSGLQNEEGKLNIIRSNYVPLCQGLHYVQFRTLLHTFQ